MQPSGEQPVNYAPETQSYAPQQPVNAQGQPTDNPVQWQGPEYIVQPKTSTWYLLFGIVVLVLIAVAALLIQSWSFAILVPVMAAALIMYINRPPRMIQYVLSGKGLYINEVLHPLTEFRSFGVREEHGVQALVFVPVKRFKPGLTVYFPPEMGEAVVDILGARMPMEEMQPDFFDKLIRRLRL